MTTVPTGSRFQAWAALFIFSCVCIMAHATSLPSVVDATVNWVTAAISISIIFSFSAVLAHFFIKDNFVGQWPEGGVALLLLIFWCASLPSIMSAANGIAVSGFVITNSNLYFFSWISFAFSLYIVGDYAQEFSGQQFKTEVSPTNTKWCGLFAASIVVLSASASLHQDISCSNMGWYICQRIAFAVSLGVLGMICSAIAFAVIAMGKMTATVESIIAGVMFILYIFGVGFLTFSDGPATTLGNLYFATWIGFVLSLSLLSAALDEMNANRNAEGDETMNSAPAPGLADVEQQEGPSDGVELSLEKEKY